MGTESSAGVQIIAILLVGGLFTLVALHFLVFFIFRRSERRLVADFDRRMKELVERKENDGSVLPQPVAVSSPISDPGVRKDSGKWATTSGDEWQKAREADGATIQKTRDGRGQVAIGG